MCRSTTGDRAQDDSYSQQLFVKIAVLLDDVINVLARHERQQPPSRTIH